MENRRTTPNTLTMSTHMNRFEASPIPSPVRRRLLRLAGASAALPLASFLAACGRNDSAARGTDADSSTASASGAAAAKNADRWAAIEAAKEIRIATEGTWAPWCFHAEDGTLTGFDVELGRLIARELNVQPVFIEGKWDGLLAGLDAGRWDVMVNGIDLTPERAKAFRFSDPYAINRTAVIVRSDNDDIRTIADLKGKRTANTISSTYAMIAEAQGAAVSGVDDLNQTFELLLSKRIDATLNAEVAFTDYVRAHPEAPVRIACFAPESMPVAIPMKAGAETEELQKRINGALAKLRGSGELSELAQRFFGTDITRTDAQPQP